MLAIATLLAMTTWFSASAVLPQLTEAWDLSTTTRSWLTIAVQLGFVVGAVLSAVLTLADVVNPRVVMFWSAVGAATANIGLVAADGPAMALPLRFLTGAFLAGVYPPGLKAMSTWFVEGRGVALGVMVGALTAGSAALVRWVATDGPHQFPTAAFRPRQVVDVIGNQQWRLASYGYFGHMWELYAMWTWTAAFLAASFEAAGTGSDWWVPLGTFGAIGIGALGCVVGGRLADRSGREWLTSVSMVSSGGAALVVGLTFGAAPALTIGVVLFWGFWVVADSAQFSTLVTEVADQRYVGTAVTVQIALGFTLTVVTIWLIPVLVDAVGWRWAFVLLAPGPALGTAAMQRLRRLRSTARAG